MYGIIIVLLKHLAFHVVVTRRMEAFAKLIDEKIEAFKKSLVETLTNEIKSFSDEQKEEIRGLFETKKVELSTKINTEYIDSIKAVQDHIKELKLENTKLNKTVDNLQQYIRRQNVRIFNVPVPNKETSSQVEQIVKNMIRVGEIDIPVESLDRAHRIGKKNRSADGVVTQQIIVRFTSFRDRTKFYRGRKVIKEKYGVGSVGLDLTGERYSLLKEARTLTNNVEGIQFAYSDVNCNLRVFTTSGEHLIFDSISSLHDLISSW